MKKIFLSLAFLFLFNQPLYAQNTYYNISQNRIVLYDLSSNRHGLTLYTSQGVFYLGKSQDAIQKIHGIKRYGYWYSNNNRVTVKISDDIFTFYL